MPIKTLFFVYLFWIKFCLSERLRDCTLVHSLSLICYLVTTQSLGASSNRQQPADSACQALLKLALHVLAAAAFLLITQFLLCRVCGVGLCLLQRSNADSYGVQSRVLSERSVAKPASQRCVENKKQSR